LTHDLDSSIAMVCSSFVASGKASCTMFSTSAVLVAFLAAGSNAAIV